MGEINHTHYCRECGGNWHHAESECTEKPSEQFVYEVTDMACPQHDGLPYHER